MSNCKHLLFLAGVMVDRIEDTDPSRPVIFRANVSIVCRNCGIPFEFKGLEPGYLESSPTVDFTKTEGRFPIMPTTDPVAQFKSIMNSTGKK